MLWTPDQGKPRVVAPGFPAVHLPKRSVAGEMDEHRALVEAMNSVRGVERPLPVMFDGRWIATVMGQHYSTDVWVRKEQRRRGRMYEFAGHTTYADFQAERNLNKKHVASFLKKATTTAVAATWYDLWPVGTEPAAGAYGGTAFTAKQLDDTQVGALWHNGNVSTDLKSLSHVAVAPAAGLQTLWFYDRTLTYENCNHNANSNQAFTNTLGAQRHIGTGDMGLQICATAQTVGDATAANLTQLQYTDDAGNATQNMPTTPTVAVIVSAVAPTSTLGARVVYPATAAAVVTWGPFLPLKEGDNGARLIANWTTSAAQGAEICFVMLYPLAIAPMPTAAIGVLVDQLVQTFGISLVADGTCLALLVYRPATGSQTLYGSCEFVWG